MKINHEFVEFVPVKNDMKYKTVYISIKYKTASHLCMCGCGEVVVTPIKPNRWKIIFDGETISLSPSIGNCNLKCHSHYWVDKSEVEFLKVFSNQECEDEIFYEKLALHSYKKKQKMIRKFLNKFKKNND